MFLSEIKGDSLHTRLHQYGHSFTNPSKIKILSQIAEVMDTYEKVCVCACVCMYVLCVCVCMCVCVCVVVVEGGSVTRDIKVSL